MTDIIWDDPDEPWILSLIKRLRPDLLKFDEDHRRKHLNSDWLLQWLITSGLQEYEALLHDPAVIAFFNGPSRMPGLNKLQAAIYQMRPDVREAYPIEDGTHAFVDWFNVHGIHEHGLFPLVPQARESQASPTQSLKRSAYRTSEFGVNLVGYVFGQLGIGEDLRMAALSCKAAGIPFTLLDFPPGPSVPNNDRSLAEHVSENARFGVNIFCLTALEHGRFFAERGTRNLAGRYNIGYWPWELGRWPREWVDLTRMVDEVWVSSKHTYASLEPVCPVPLVHMPMAVELSTQGRKTRSDFGLPKQAYLFCFAFDLNSSMHRKNPEACIHSFIRAFPQNQKEAFTTAEVGLVVKVHKPTKRHPAWERLKAIAASDPRIHIIEGTLSRDDLLGLYACCDCFVSLHRAEGFGRGIAEALQLGLHVITTGFSGNVDFCRPPHSDLVGYKLVRVRKGQYPYHNDQLWADPDIEQSIQLMRNAVGKKRRNVSAEWPEFSARVVGARYLSRLEKIWAARRNRSSLLALP